MSNVMTCASPEQSTLRVDETLSKIENMAEIPEGWIHGRGTRIGQSEIKTAIIIYKSVTSIINIENEVDVSPTDEGGIVLSFKVDDEFMDVSINPNKTFDLVHEKGIGMNYEIIAQKFGVTLKYVLDNIWHLYGHYTSNAITETSKDSTNPSTIAKARYLFFEATV